jgi:hypothetical protein
MLSRKLFLGSALILGAVSFEAHAQDSAHVQAVRADIHKAVTAACENAPEAMPYALRFADAIVSSDVGGFKSNLNKLGCLVRRAERADPRDIDTIGCATDTVTSMMVPLQELTEGDNGDSGVDQGSVREMVEYAKRSVRMSDTEICNDANL